MSLDQRFEPLIASLRQQVADVVEGHVRQLASQLSAQAQEASARAMLDASEHLSAEHRAALECRVRDATAQLEAHFEGERRELGQALADADARHRDAEARLVAAQADARSLGAQVGYLQDRLADLDHAWRAAARHGRLENALARLGHRATATGALESVVDALHTLLARVRLYLVDGDRLTLWALRGFESTEIVDPPLESQAPWCRATVFEESVQLLREPWHLVPFADEGVREAVVAPVRVGDAVVGLVYLDGRGRSPVGGGLEAVLPDVERVLELATPILEAVTAEQVWRAAMGVSVAQGAEAER